MDLWRSLVQPPCSSRASSSWLPRSVSRRLLNISKDGDATTSLDSLCQSSVIEQSTEEMDSICEEGLATWFFYTWTMTCSEKVVD